MNATVLNEYKVITTKSGDIRGVIEFILEDNSTTNIWSFHAKNRIFEELAKGDKVILEKKGKYYAFLEKVESANIEKVTPGTSLEIAAISVKKQQTEYIKTGAGMYKFCYDQISLKFNDYGLSDEDIRIMSTTLYIDVSKQKFN